MKNCYQIPCNIAQTLNLIGDRWSLLILHRLLMGCGTYKELQAILEGIPTNLLSERLKTFEADGLVKSTLYQEHPPRYQYELTSSGQDLQDVFNSIILWGEKHLNTCYKKLVHQECGGHVVHQYFCTQCGKTVSGQELVLQQPSLQEEEAI